MRLEELEETVAEESPAHARRSGAEQQEPPAARFRPKPPGRRPLPAHLPREIVVHEPDITCQCNNCDPTRLVTLGETATEVLEKIPARVKVIRHLRPKYACRACETCEAFAQPSPLCLFCSQWIEMTFRC
jgi:transposase